MWLRELFEQAEARMVSFDGPYDPGPDGEFVHGYMRVASKLLEIAIGVPAASFSALSAVCADRNDGPLTLTVRPFESDELWNGKDNLLLRGSSFPV